MSPTSCASRTTTRASSCYVTAVRRLVIAVLLLGLSSPALADIAPPREAPTEKAPDPAPERPPEKAPDKALIPCTFNFEVPSSGIPFKLYGTQTRNV